MADFPVEGHNYYYVDELLFDREGDRFLKACGCNRDWPSGRGIFHNADKTFLVWVNEEDQLRIISMRKGADIGAVFERLSRAAAHIETVAKFSHDDHLGYITSCPTNLGTALRASVHIKLPKLGRTSSRPSLTSTTCRSEASMVSTPSQREVCKTSPTGGDWAGLKCSWSKTCMMESRP